MFHRHRWINFVLSLTFVLAFGGCGGLGSGCGCTMGDLPGGALPADQTIEGGAQLRVTEAGFSKLTELVPAVINDALDGGFCIPAGNVFDAFVASADYCTANDGGCNPGCRVDVNIEEVNMSVPTDDTFNVEVVFDVDTDLHVEYDIFFVINGSCNANLYVDDAAIDLDIGFGIDDATGELTLGLQNINRVDLSGVSVSGCGLIGDIVDAAIDVVSTILDSFIGDFLLDLLRPVVETLLQGLLPDPLGIEGLVDVGAMVSSVSPGTEGTLEMRGVPGGYVQLRGGGLSVGLITGFNADEDISTRTTDLDSEPSFCVPPMLAPDFAAPPASLGLVAGRNTFALLPADEFLGLPDPAADLAIGLSETTLDLIGHHAVTSGAMCLGIGTSVVSALTLGTVGILLPSLASLGSADGSDPLLLVTRPQRALDFTVGDGSAGSPNLDILFDDLEIDFYAFLYERYVRAFTIRLTMHVGVNIEFALDEDGNPAVLPTLVGLDADQIELTVLNDEFLSEDRAVLEAVLPALFVDLALPLVSDGLGAITLPDFAGFSLENLQVQKVTTSEDDFLAIYATLGGASAALAPLANRFPSVKKLFDAQQVAPVTPVRTGAAHLVGVDTPAPAQVVEALVGSGGRLPAVTLALAERDSLNRPLEWTWNLDGGIWRPFVRGPELILRDRAFAWQGRYTVGLRSRVVGDYRTLSKETIEVPVVIDSAGPRIHEGEARADGDDLVVPANDMVSPTETLEIAFGQPSADEPATAWTRADRLPIATAEALAEDGLLAVHYRDQLGNQSMAVIDLGPVLHFHGTAPPGAGCACNTASDAGSLAGTALLALLTGLLAFGGAMRRRTMHRIALSRIALSRIARGAAVFAVWLGLASALSVLPSCSCGSDPGVGDDDDDGVCEISDDCAEFCADDEIPFCLDNMCLCTGDVPYGRIGRYSDIALGAGSAVYVSAYAESHGDLVVARWDEGGRIPDGAWEFVDGVPDGPVILEDSEIRGGIFDPGPDVGLFTSIAVASDQTVMVSYFDRDRGSLKLATKSGSGGSWQTSVVDEGTINADPELGYELAGQYSSITLRTDDNRPAIAYYAEVSAGGTVTTEVRYASAQTTDPQSPADWQVWVVDSAVLPPADPEAPDLLKIPNGVGAFTTAARQIDQAPVVVYYDRLNGDLKASRFDAINGVFAIPEIFDGADGSDVGWYPSVAVDAENNLHIAYQSATRDDLLYLDSSDGLPTVVDDGYRIVGTTEDGLPKPEFHFVGEDSSVLVTQNGPVVVYQDSTSHELLLSVRSPEGLWEYEALAGDEIEFAGAFGFYAAADYDGEAAVISNWVLDQRNNDQWVEIERRIINVE